MFTHMQKTAKGTAAIHVIGATKAGMFLLL
jgi:hypothetical protein